MFVSNFVGNSQQNPRNQCPIGEVHQWSGLIHSLIYKNYTPAFHLPPASTWLAHRYVCLSNNPQIRHKKERCNDSHVSELSNKVLQTCISLQLKNEFGTISKFEECVLKNAGENSSLVLRDQIIPVLTELSIRVCRPAIFMATTYILWKFWILFL